MSNKIMNQLTSWRELRNKLSFFDDLEKISQTMDYWERVPTVNYAMDYDSPSSWLTPWEIISDGYYDTVAIAYMMSETLILSDIEPERIELRYIQDKIDNSRLMILIIDDSYVLNYSYGEICNYEEIKNRLITFRKYKKIGGKYAFI